MIFSNESVAWDAASTGQPQGAVATCRPQTERRFFIECRICGFEPEGQETLPRACCPKCFSDTWHRVIRPGMMVRRPPAATSTARLRRLAIARRV